MWEQSCVEIWKRIEVEIPVKSHHKAPAESLL